MFAFLSFLGPVWDVVKKIVGVVSSTEEAKYNAEATEVSAIASEQATVQTKWWFVALIPPLFAIPYVAYIWKIVFWDTVLQLGTTPPLKGDASTVMLMIVGFYFFHNMALSISRT